MQSTDLEEIKAALWEQAYHQCSRVSCPTGACDLEDGPDERSILPKRDA